MSEIESLREESSKSVRYSRSFRQVRHSENEFVGELLERHDGGMVVGPRCRVVSRIYYILPESRIEVHNDKGTDFCWRLREAREEIKLKCT